jgi:hypothetical protein
LIYENGKVGKPIEILKKVFNEVKTNRVQQRTQVLVGNRTYLLSQNSQILENKKLISEITSMVSQNNNSVKVVLPNTSSMVRGEELYGVTKLYGEIFDFSYSQLFRFKS